MISAVLPLSEIEDGLARLRSGAAVKVVLTP
jgi:hypothetical protein